MQSTSAFSSADRDDLLGLVCGPRAGEGDVMTTLPSRPSLDHLRRQARNLLRAAQAGDTGSAARIGVVSQRLTLAAAQLAVARQYGFASWGRLKTEGEAPTTHPAPLAQAFSAGR